MLFSSFSFRPLTTALALGCTSFACVNAWADDPNPYYIGVSEAITHDNNVFRGTSDLARGDTYTSTGLLGGIDQPFGRQRFYANGSLRYNHFNNESQLNNTSYGLNTGLDLSTVNHISGGLTYTINQNLFNYGGGNTVQSSSKNLERSQQTGGRVSWGLVSLWSIDASVNHRSLNYSDPLYNFANLTQDQGSLGVTYRPSGLISGGVAYRATHGKYGAVDRTFNRQDIDFTTTWTPTGQSTVSGRVSIGRQKYNTSISSDSVSSGSLSWDYRPTGKLGFTAWASRDTGAESSFFNFASVAGSPQTAIGDNSQRTTTLALTTNYALTGKIGVVASARYSKRTLNNSIIFTGAGTQAATGTDTNKVYSLGANYQALRSLLIACNVSHDSRSSSGQLSFPYSDNTVTCSGQLTLR